MKKDYLKYWKVVREYTKYEHGLSTGDIDMLLFLYSESYFSKEDFEQYYRMFPWDKDRFAKLRKDGWIDTFRKYESAKGLRSIYKLSSKSKRLINIMYERLEGKMLPESNKKFLKEKKMSFSQRRLKEGVILMNQKRKQQRHRPRE